MNNFRYVLLMAIGWPLSVFGQNLVPNGSFEEYVECPWGANQVDLAVDWKKWYYSPEYFHSCTDNEWTTIPLNYFADQYPSHGNAYCGFIAWHGPGSNYSELIGVELTETLVPGSSVFVSLKLAASIGGTGANFQNTCSHVGVRFTTTEQIWIGVTPLPNYAHLILSEPLPVGGEWFTLSGIVTPDSAYRYISVGRFHIVDSLQVNVINPDGNNDWGAYFLVDEVCVAYDPNYCDFDLAISEYPIQEPVVYPNPFIEGFSLQISVPGNKNIRIVDLRGRVVREFSIDEPDAYISLADLPAAMYAVQVSMPGYIIPLTKVVKMNP